MQPIALIACSKSKADRPCLAGNIYTGDLFKKSRAYVEARGLRWFILSARHGLVAPDVTLEPYDTALETMGAAERWSWSSRVEAQIREAIPSKTPLLVLAGDLYRAPLARLLHRVEVPMRGLGIGEQRQWLARETATLRTARAEMERAEGRGTLGDAMRAQREGRELVEHTARLRGIVQ